MSERKSNKKSKSKRSSKKKTSHFTGFQTDEKSWGKRLSIDYERFTIATIEAGSQKRHWKGERDFLRNLFIVRRTISRAASPRVRDQFIFTPASSSKSAAGGNYLDAKTRTGWSEPQTHFLQPSLVVRLAESNYRPSREFVNYINDTADWLKEAALVDSDTIEAADKFVNEYYISVSGAGGGGGGSRRSSTKQKIKNIDDQIRVLKGELAALRDAREELRAQL
jgi:hypothetical protein